MEENKEKKLSYEELSKAASELHVQYQKLMAEYRRVTEELSRRDFEFSFTLLGMLFKVMDHPDQYKSDFVGWASDTIQMMLMSFSQAIGGEEKANDNNSNEAE